MTKICKCSKKNAEIFDIIREYQEKARYEYRCNICRNIF